MPPPGTHGKVKGSKSQEYGFTVRLGRVDRPFRRILEAEENPYSHPPIAGRAERSSNLTVKMNRHGTDDGEHVIPGLLLVDKCRSLARERVRHLDWVTCIGVSTAQVHADTEISEHSRSPLMPITSMEAM